MTMFRQSPPEYRALVVENERDFRGDLIYTIESLDIGISVIGEAADYEDAREIIDSGEVDLLVTDINLTDAPRFRVGHQDGTELAQYAHDRYDIPCIFLTAFADYDPEVVTRAAAADPIGFIQKQGSEVGVQTQHLIRLALRRLELIRREKETAQQLSTIVEQLGKALLYIDLDGQILDFNDAFVTLIGTDGENIIDQHWEDVIRIEDPSGRENPLRPLIDSGASGRLPALALNRADDEAVLVGFRITQTEHLREPCTLLIMQELSDKLTEFRALRIEPNSTLLGFGIQADANGSELDAAELRMMMLRLRALLIEAVRTGDFVSRPMNTLVVVRLLDTDQAEGLAIAHALHEKLRPTLLEYHPNTTLSVGAAFRDPNSSSHATIAAALGALDLAQRDASSPVKAAGGISRVEDLSLLDANAQMHRATQNRSFEIASRLFDISVHDGLHIEGLKSSLDRCLQSFPRLLGYSIFIEENGHSGNSLLCREQDATGFLDAEVVGSIQKLMQELANNSDYETRFISFQHVLGDDFSVLHVGESESQRGYFVLRCEPDDGAGFPAADVNEQQLAALASRHLTRLLKQSSDAPKLASSAGRNSYNPYALRTNGEALETVRLLLQLDVPIAVVAETGMRKGKLLQHAYETGELGDTAPIRFESAGKWRDPNLEADFTRLLAGSENTLLIFIEAQQLHASLQLLLADVMQRRMLKDDDSGLALKNTRFAVTLPESPQSLMTRGALEEKLASALGAGVVTLQPLRESTSDILSWANRILETEARNIGKTGLSFDTQAIKAIQQHLWPGNVDELTDRVREAVQRSTREELSVLDLGLFKLEALQETTSGSNV